MTEKVTVTVRASGAHPDVLTVQDAMRQVLDLFDLLSPNEESDDAMAWRLSYASTNSPFTAQGEAVSLFADVDITVIARTKKADLVRGLSALGRGEVIEEYKVGRRASALRSMLERNLNGVGTTEIKLFDDTPSIHLTPKYAEAAIRQLSRVEQEPARSGLDLRFGRARDERGSIEGYFLDVGFHYGHPAIRILERKTRSVLWCRVDRDTREKISAEADYNDVWNKQRIRVRGRIKYDKDGRIAQVTAVSLERIIANQKTVDDIFDPNFTGSLETSQYLDLLREGNLAAKA